MVHTDINPVDVIFMTMTDGHIVGKKFPAFYKTKYKSNPDELMKNTLSKGYIEEISNYKESLSNSKVTKLKMILKSYKLNISGRKAELIERILENIPQEELEDIFNEKQYRITEKGKNFAKQNSFALIYHETKNLSNYITLEDYYELCLESPHLSAIEVLVEYFNENSELHLKFKNWESYIEIQEMLYIITKDVKYKCLISFVGINFLNSKINKVLPEHDEIKKFKEVFTHEVKIFHEYSPKHSIKDTQNIILSAVEAENLKIPDKVKNKNDNDIQNTEVSSSEHDFIIRQPRSLNLGSQLIFPMVFGAVGFVVLIYFYLKF